MRREESSFSRIPTAKYRRNNGDRKPLMDAKTS